jgi:hypothetical protein
MKTCTPCNGTGLVGSGDKPWLHLGRVERCETCKGTGKVKEVVPEQPAPAASELNDEGEQATSTNGPTQNHPEGAVKCAVPDCQIHMSGGDNLPKYCPSHNDLNSKNDAPATPDDPKKNEDMAPKGDSKNI